MITKATKANLFINSTSIKPYLIAMTILRNKPLKVTKTGEVFPRNTQQHRLKPATNYQQRISPGLQLFTSAFFMCFAAPHKISLKNSQQDLDSSHDRFHSDAITQNYLLHKTGLSCQLRLKKIRSTTATHFCGR